MRIAVIDQSTGNVKAIVEPGIQRSPITPASGEALIVIESHANVASLASLEIVNDWMFNFSTVEFEPKPA